MLIRFCVRDKVGVSIIDSISHCHTENALKRVKNQEMWHRFFIEDKVGVSIIDSIPHCHTENVSILCKGQNWSIYQEPRNVDTFLCRRQSWSF